MDVRSTRVSWGEGSGGTRLFGAHEVGETLSTFWNDVLHYRAQVPSDIVHVERAV